MTERDWTASFNQVFAEEPSTIETEIWQEVFGDEYPAEAQPYSYVTRSELREFVAELRVGEHSLLVDVGCGRGGPGLWVAAATGASLLGVDISSTALEQARRRAAQVGLNHKAQYELGEFAAIPANDGAAGAVMSIDALLFAPDKGAAVAEIFRVLAPGGRLVATTWDYRSQPAGRPPQVADHRPLLTHVGFDVLRYDETALWRHYISRTDELMLERLSELAQASGESEEDVRASILEADAAMSCMIRRVLIVAQRPLGSAPR